MSTILRDTLKSENFGRNLKNYQIVNGLSLPDFSRKTGVKPHTLRGILEGRHEPKLETVIKIMLKLNLKFTDLVK